MTSLLPFLNRWNEFQIWRGSNIHVEKVPLVLLNKYVSMFYFSHVFCRMLKRRFFQKLTSLLNAFTKKEVASFDFERRKRKRRAAGSTRDVHLRSWRSLLHIQFPLPPRYASRVSSWKNKLFVWKHFFKGHLVAVCLSRNWSQPWKFILNYLGRSSWTSLWQKFGHHRFKEHCPARSQS